MLIYIEAYSIYLSWWNDTCPCHDLMSARELRNSVLKRWLNLFSLVLLYFSNFFCEPMDTVPTHLDSQNTTLYCFALDFSFDSWSFRVFWKRLSGHNVCLALDCEFVWNRLNPFQSLPENQKQALAALPDISYASEFARKPETGGNRQKSCAGWCWMRAR